MYFGTLPCCAAGIIENVTETVDFAGKHIGTDTDTPAAGRLPVVERFYTLQGEGFHSGKPAFFIRIAGCDVGCPWCDSKESWSAENVQETDAESLAAEAAASGAKAVVVTGGEPLLHNLDGLCALLGRTGAEIYLETSGSAPPSGSFDWICLSPKRRKAPLPEMLAIADELKVVIGETGDFAWAEENAAKVKPGCRLYLQPEWNRMQRIMPEIVEYAKRHPEWSVSLQTHKFMNIP